jgi:hypothetical protein
MGLTEEDIDTLDAQGAFGAAGSYSNSKGDRR